MNHSLTGPILKEWREAARLSQEEFARKLGVSREWMGKLERGERPVSADIYLRFEKLKRELEFTDRGGDLVVDIGNPRPVAMLAESTPSHGDLEQIRSELRGDLEKTIRAAGDDRDRLGWMKVQLRENLAVPVSWSGKMKIPLGPSVPITLPSQTVVLSAKTGKPRDLPAAGSASRKAHTG